MLFLLLAIWLCGTLVGYCRFQALTTGVFGWTDDPNQSDLVEPLDHLPFDQWWFHGKINNPPKDGLFMELPAGGKYSGQIACNST
jgi:hypothetical protein